MKGKNGMKRNGKIEIFRFVFCIIIVLYHINLDIWNGDLLIGEHLSFFIHGRTGVEFFFLLSGFFMAKSLYNRKQPDTSIGVDTVCYVYRKIKAVFFPYMLLSCVTVIYILFTRSDAMEYTVDRLPSLLFLQRTGIADEGFITVGWYISSMLLAIAVIYPFLGKFYDSVSLIAAPVISSLAIGALIHETGHLPQRAFAGFIHLANIRAIAVVLLGVFTFRVSRYLMDQKLSKAKWTALIITENLCWIISFYYMVSVHSEKYEGHITYLMAAAVAICFARELRGNHITEVLGRLSLPIYLSQSIVRKIVNEQFDALNDITRALLIVSGTLFIGLIVDRITMAVKYRKGSSS